ncbi:MAG: hypothetical protein JNL41_04635 [Phenylobacterium sp.]|uniref:hypothetical protein n=1 Tax=Phenylobacterium sp. TaxID=1871053 RepID=UPI001A5B2FD3|nr:hypothetical protein [Phenylobacterium sp.]MBL8553543.1 hypothetical protein [Phenylobacterium sp.]
MRPLLRAILCSLIAAPGAALAQDIPDPANPPPTPLALAPLPAVEPTRPTPEAVTSAPPPAPVDGAPAPRLATPTTVAPVLVEKQPDKTAQAVGGLAVSVAGGAAGSAVAGPVGGFVGKRLATSLFGIGKDKVPEVRAMSAEEAAAQAAAQLRHDEAAAQAREKQAREKKVADAR